MHLNSDVLHSAINMSWRIISGPLTLLLVPLFTSASIQGYWYTFISLSALTVFADLGFTSIASQFVAHEFAFLSLGKDGLIHGDPDHLASTAALLRFVIQWGGISGLVVMPIVLIIGIVLFAQKGFDGLWVIPWILFSVGTLAQYWAAILASFLQGARQVARVQKITLVARITQTLVLFGLLVSHMGLYALAVATLVGNCLLAIILVWGYGKSLKQLLTLRSEQKWGRDVLSLLWRYAMSWVGGYLNMQVFTPIVFQLKGPVLAGKIGITMAIWMAAITLSTVWFSANGPRINILVERKEERRVNELTKELLRLTFLTFLGCLVAVALALVVGSFLYIEIIERIVRRFMGISSAMILIVVGCISFTVNAMATYLRAHKEEPFLLPSVAAGLGTAFFTIIVVRYLGPEFAFAGFLASTVLSFPWFAAIYRRKRRHWEELEVAVEWAVQEQD